MSRHAAATRHAATATRLEPQPYGWLDGDDDDDVVIEYADVEDPAAVDRIVTALASVLWG